MDTANKSALTSKIDSSLLTTLEAYNEIDDQDELFEAYLGFLLQVDFVRQAEIQLFNTTKHLISVAESQWTGPPGNRHPKVYSDSWLLNYPVQHTTKRPGKASDHPVFTVPLMDAGTIMGFLNIRLERLNQIDQRQLSQFHLIGMQLSSSLKEMRLKTEIRELKAELKQQIANNATIQHQATSLSKELYAISAISARINQSMDFDQTLHHCLITIRKVFKAFSILIYTQNDANSKIELAAADYEEAAISDELYVKYLKSIGKNYLREVLRSDKPLVRDRLAALLPVPEEIAGEAPVTSLIGVTLVSGDARIGAMILLFRSPEPINPSGLRLLSGMANIMGMNIENKVLYRQSIQKTEEVDFLFRSIVKFNKTLDLSAILTSVAEKGVEYCGIDSRVYLFSHLKIRLIVSRYRKQGKGYTIRSSLREKSQFGVLMRIYAELSEIVSDKPLLIRSIARCRKIGPTAKQWFSELNIASLVAVPLKVGKKPLGMFLLVRGAEALSFGNHEMQFAEALASAASLTIENARTYAASQEMSDFLEEKISQKTSEISQIQARQKVRVENRKDIIFQVNRYNRFVFANKAMVFLSGLPREILCHKDFRADGVVAEEDRDRINGLFRKILNKKIPLVKDTEYHHVNQNGNNHVISLTIFPEYDQQGNVVGVEGVGRDITEEKRLATELKKAKELALLGEFSSAVAHQMRNPLGNILMGTKRLESALGLDGGKWEADKGGDFGSSTVVDTAERTRVAEILKNLSQGVHNLNQVVTELLEYTKTLKLRPSAQRMGIIIDETVQTFTSLLHQNHIKVRKHFKDELLFISVDAVLIAQVMQNVVYNAIQAMPTGGNLDLYMHSDVQDPNQLLVSIKDSGIGIDPAEIDRVFRPFYTTKTLGTGLGLSVAHRIIEAHGGRMQVCRNPCPHLFAEKSQQKSLDDPQASRGTTVHIMLPVTDGRN